PLQGVCAADGGAAVPAALQPTLGGADERGQRTAGAGAGEPRGRGGAGGGGAGLDVGPCLGGGGAGGGLGGAVQREHGAALGVEVGGEQLHVLTQRGPGAADGAGDDAARLRAGAEDTEEAGERLDLLLREHALERPGV